MRTNRLAPCPHGKDHDTQIAYDVPNDQHFVACMTCGCEGRRGKTRRGAGQGWRLRKLSRNPEIGEDE